MSFRATKGLLRTTDVAIFGAGVAGLSCVHRLHDLIVSKRLDATYRVIESSGNVGGRVCTHTTATTYWDYGVSRIKEPVRKPGRSFFRRMRELQAVHPWGRKRAVYDCSRPGDGLVLREYSEREYCFVPSTRFPLRHMYASVGGQQADQILLGQSVSEIRKWERNQWIYRLGDRWMRADAIILACPPRSILRYFVGTDEFPLPDSPLIDHAVAADFDPCWVVLVGYDDPDFVPFDQAQILNHPAIASISNNHSKPQRPTEATSITVICTAAYSRQNAGRDSEAISAEVLRMVTDDLGGVVGAGRSPSYLAAHLWEYGTPSTSPPALESFYDSEACIGVCGDWTLGPRMEDAITSGVRAANGFAGVADVDECEFETLSIRGFGTPMKEARRSKQTQGKYAEKVGKFSVIPFEGDAHDGYAALVRSGAWARATPDAGE